MGSEAADDEKDSDGDETDDDLLDESMGESSKEDSEDELSDAEMDPRLAGCMGQLEWHSVIGASGLLGKDAELQYQIRYKKEGDFDPEHCCLVAPGDFNVELKEPHPRIDRSTLGWNEDSVGKEVLVFWNKPGVAAWYLGTLVAYDSKTTKHKIKWDDGDRDWNVDLMACSRCKEWRFVQSGEDASAFLEEDSE